MLQEQYEKHNLEMQPYRHYLAEYQNMDPRDISRHLEIPFDENTGLFRVNFMERSYTVSHPDLEIHCLDEEDNQAVLCGDIHAKITAAPLFYRRRLYEGYRKSSFLSRPSLGRCILPPVLWTLHLETVQNVWKSAGDFLLHHGEPERNTQRVWRCCI